MFFDEKKGSGIRQIKKDDLTYLQLDLKNKKQVANSLAAGSDFDDQLAYLRRTFVPMYHLDFDQINDIEDAAFEQFLVASTNLTVHLEASSNQIVSNHVDDVLLLRIRFSNCNFDFSANRRPFKGLKAQEVHMYNMSSQYLANSIFDASVISELHFESALNFMGFLDLSDTLPNGNYLFTYIKCFKIIS